MFAVNFICENWYFCGSLEKCLNRKKLEPTKISCHTVVKEERVPLPPSLRALRTCHTPISFSPSLWQARLGSLSKDVFERHTSTGSDALSLFKGHGANKFVLLSFFSLIKTIYPRVWTKPLPNAAKSPLPSLKNAVAKAPYYLSNSGKKIASLLYFFHFSVVFFIKAFNKRQCFTVQILSIISLTSDLTYSLTISIYPTRLFAGFPVRVHFLE